MHGAAGGGRLDTPLQLSSSTRHPPPICRPLLLHLLLLTFSFLPASCGRLAAPKPCPGQCQHDGNCNHELGVCECNFGWNGPTCEHPLLGACRSSDSPTALVMYGRAWPKSCQCWRQLFNHSQGVHHIKAPRSQWLGFGEAGFEMMLGIQDLHPGGIKGSVRYCYEREGVPPDRQFSDVPLATDSGVKYLDPGNDFKEVERPTEILSFRDNRPLAPLDSCPDRCHDRGACIKTEQHLKPGLHLPPFTAPATLACVCRKGFIGPSCGEQDRRPRHTIPASSVDMGDRSCMNGCSGIGQCLAGFCSCPAGHWGLDCSRSKVYQQQPGEANKTTACAGLSRPQLRIYRYELPWQVTFPYESDDGYPSYDQLYSAFERFFETLAGDWAVRTEDPGEADLFYVPMLLMYRNHRWRPHQQVWMVMQYIKEQYSELWGRNQGRDHFMWMTGDFGPCYLRNDPLVQAPMKIVHWGIQLPHKLYTPSIPATCALDNPPTYCCYLAAKDIVAPCADVGNSSKEYTEQEHWTQALDAESQPRKNLLYFGGGLRLDIPAYSGGARQAFHHHVLQRKDPRVKFGGATEDYRDSTFCFCPYGDGWGNRLAHALLAGCIPVIVQEHVHQPFDDLLPYEELSLNLRVQDMPQLLDILEAVPRERIQQYRQKLYQYRKAFYWYGDGEAYNMTLKSLRRRLYNSCGSQYRRTDRRGLSGATT